MYILRNNEERSYKHCCNEKSINTAYSKIVFVALIIQHGMRMHHIAICGLPRSTNFSTLSHHWDEFWKNVTDHKMCVLIFSTTFV